MVSVAPLPAPVPGLVGSFVLENAGKAGLNGGFTTLGQVFAQGEYRAGQVLTARIDGESVPVQVDVKSTWPDGSARMVVLTLERPALAAGAEEVVQLIAPGTAAAAAPGVGFASALEGHSFVVTLTPAGGAAMQVDVLAALKDALASGKASLWQSGPLASQARVEIAPPGTSQRLVFDVTVYADKSFAVEAQFNNDRAMEAVGGTLTYGVSVALDGRVVANETLRQTQYQNWHAGFSSDPDHGGQGLGSASSGWLNIVQDVAKLERLGVVPDYDLSLTVPEQVLRDMAAATQAPTWLDPLSNNGVAMNMYMTGGRGDIGFLTQGNAAWLLSGDPRAAAYALGQAEAASAAPWHFWDAAHKTWLNTDAYAKLWTDPRGGTGKAGVPGSTGLTQQIDGSSGWAVDVSHQPSLSFVPYIMTGERWMLDNLLAQASASVMSTWPAVRGNAADLVVSANQVRGAAWAMRELEDAAWAAPDGSVEKAYFRAAADANWAWIAQHLDGWKAEQGEAYGWLPGIYGDGTMMGPWQQDFFAGIAITAAARGNADALAYLNWAKNFLVGRFEHAADGFNPHDGAAYNIAIRDLATGRLLTTWEEIGAETVARNMSNGKGWAEAYYAQTALATLAGIHLLTGDVDALRVYKMLIAQNPFLTAGTDFAAVASWAVTIPGLYGIGSGDDVMTLDGPLAGRVIDMLAGGDRLVLTDGGNLVEVRNTETVMGGTGNDTVLVTVAGGPGLVDLGAGDDFLSLPDSGRTVLTVRNVERIAGGTGADVITLDTAVNGGDIDLGGADDSLTLSGAGANRLTVRNVELLQGGAANDTVTLGNIPAGMIVDLGDGLDTLVLPAATANAIELRNVETVIGGSARDAVTLGGNGANTVTLAHVEQVTGGNGADTVTFQTAVTNGVVDLRVGADRLVLSSAGSNSVTVANVETILGGGAADDVTLSGRAWDVLVSLGNGSDRLTLDTLNQNRVTIAGVETVIGGSLADTIVFETPARGTTIDLGDGQDTVILSAEGRNIVSLRNVEYIQGGTSTDIITLLAPAADAGVAKLAAIPTPNTLRVDSIGTIKGSAAADRIIYIQAAKDGVVALGGGRDSLYLYEGAANKVTVAGVESIYGGGYGDDVAITGALKTIDIIDLGYGADILKLDKVAALNFAVTVANVETVIGGAANETVTFSSAANNATIDLGEGNDRLELSGFFNTVAVANVEKVIGNAGEDRVTVTGGNATYLDGAAAADRLTGGAGADTLVGGAGADTLTGGLGADRFLFRATADSPVSVPDLITDFTIGVDQLAFEGLQSKAFAWRGAAAFTATGRSEAHYVNGTQILEVDVNGDGTADIGLRLNGVTMSKLGIGDFDWS